MNNEDDIKRIVREVLKEQGGVVPFHTHNNIDAPLISSLNFSSNSMLVKSGELSGVSGFNTTGLIGDTVQVYQLVIKAVFSTAENVFYLRFNNDSASHYVVPESGSATTEMYLTNDTKEQYFVNMLINATGSDRICMMNTASYTSAASKGYEQRVGIWTDNGTTELVSINVTAGQNFIEDSKYWLFALT